jgi:hypothetical protein
VENTGNVVLSRSVCYAMLAGLAVALLVQAYAAPGADAWSSAQFAQVSAQGFHFSQLLASARISAGILREQLHNTWLFLYVFLVVWLIVLAWSVMERHRLKLGIGRREVYWMLWMSLSVVSAAVVYGVGTNGIMARRYPKAVPVSDVLALGFVLALPIFAWSRMQRRRAEKREDHEFSREPGPVFTTLGLNGHDSFDQPRAPFQEIMIQAPQEGPAVPNLLTPTPDARAIAAMDKLLENTVLTVTRAPETVAEPQPVADEMIRSVTVMTAAAAPAIAAEPVIAAGAVAATKPAIKAAPAAAAVSIAPLTEDFRENLKTLNAAWGRIESAGEAIDRWFDEQRRQVIAHLETHPAVRPFEAPAPLSENFLNERLTAVDADWAAIRRSALEITRWFGDAPAADG